MNRIIGLLIFIWINSLDQCLSKTCDNVYDQCKTKEHCWLDVRSLLSVKCIDFENHTVAMKCNNKEMCGYLVPFVLNKYPDFKDCSCNDRRRFSRCSVIEGLRRHPCLVTSPTPHPITTVTTSRPINYGPYFPNLEEEKLLKQSVRLLLHNLGVKAKPRNIRIQQVSCLVRKDDCENSEDCIALKRRFHLDCNLKYCDQKSSQCLSTYHKFSQYRTFDCTCDDELDEDRRTRCVQYQTEVIDNKCLALQNNRIVFEMMPLHTANSSKTMHLLKPFIEGKYSCKRVYKSCLQDPRCLSHYIQIQKKCQWDPVSGQCAVSQESCHSALNQFYQQSQVVVYQALVCDCATKDKHCMNIKEVFRPRCAVERAGGQKVQNCLSLMQSCVQDMPCLDTYSIFTEICIPSDGKCPYTNMQCLDAVRPMWGRLLKLKCSCDEEETYKIASSEKSIRICKLIQNNLDKPTCWHPTTSPSHAINSPTFSPNEACQLKNQYNIPDNSAVRIYAPPSLRENSDICSLMCYCHSSTNRSSCKYISCSHPSEGPQNSDCIIEPEMGQSCRCEDGKVTCEPVAIPYTQKISPVLKLYYNQNDYEILRKHSTGVNMFSIGRALTAFIQSFPSGKNCEITLQSHKRNEVVYIALIKSDQLYSVSSSKSIFRYSRMLRRNHRLEKECTDTLLFLKHLIHAGYPEVRHNAYLSIFNDAQLIYPAIKPDYPSNQAHSGNSSSCVRNLSALLLFTLLAFTQANCLV